MIKEALEEIRNTNFERSLDAPIDVDRIEGLKKVLDMHNLHVLEVGSLDGYHTVQLEKIVCNLTTSDIRPDNLKKTLYRCLYENITDVRFMLLDVEDMHNKIEEDEFDLLFCSGLIYHLHHPEEFIYNIKHLFKYILLEGHIANPVQYGPLHNMIFMGRELVYTEYSEVGFADPQSSKDNKKSKWFTEESWLKIFDICNLKLRNIIYNDIANEHGRRVCYLLERN
jgi:hypothetical protein